MLFKRRTTYEKVKSYYFLLLGSALMSSRSPEPGNSDNVSETCIAKLSKSFNYLKNYKIENANKVSDVIEYSYVFTRGTQYRINLCLSSQEKNGIVITLFDQKDHYFVQLPCLDFVWCLYSSYSFTSKS